MAPVEPRVYVSAMDRLGLGRAGEDAVAEILTGRGHVILRRNVRTRYGEIDLVTAHGRDLVFIEVKTRASDEFGEPLDAVHPRKQRRLACLARAFMHERGLGNRACRFDVAAVLATRDGRVLRIEIVSHAFDAPN